MKRLQKHSTALLIVDVQERLANVMPEDGLGQVRRSCRILLEVAQLLPLPVLYTEQYPKGLGSTLPEIRAMLDQAHAERFEKTAFSACEASGLRECLDGLEPTDVIVIGMEAHVCVFQTARDLTEAGYTVHVPLDGVCSRREDHRRVGLALCERAGALQTTTETVVFDLLRDSKHEAFRALSKLIR